MSQQVDPALRDHLDELALLARPETATLRVQAEIGAEGVTIIRGAVVAELLFDLFPNFPQGGVVNLLSDNPAGVLVVLRFPASDGGAAGVEVK